MLPPSSNLTIETHSVLSSSYVIFLSGNMLKLFVTVDRYERNDHLPEWWLKRHTDRLPSMPSIPWTEKMKSTNVLCTLFGILVGQLIVVVREVKVLQGL